MSKIEQDISNKDIKFEYLKNLLSDKKDNILEKLNILTLVPESRINQDEFDNLSRYNKEMLDYLEKLKNYKNSLELYHSQYKKEVIVNIVKFIEEINVGTYKKFRDLMEKIQDLFDQSFDTFKKVEEVKKSKIFKIFYQSAIKEMKRNDEKIPFDKAYESFIDFKKLVIEHGADVIKKDSPYPQNDSQKDIIKKIKEQYKEDKSIQNELSSLMSGEQQNEDEITIMLNIKNFEKDLNAMFTFFSYFTNNENINRELEEWKEKCKDFSLAEDNSKMQKVLNELKKEGIYDYKQCTNIDNKSNYIILFNLGRYE